MLESRKLLTKVAEAEANYLQHRNRPDLKLVYASALLEQGRYEKFRHYNYQKAAHIFREVLTLDSLHPGAHYHLGFLALQEHRWEDAIDHLERSIDSDDLQPVQIEKAKGYLAAAYYGMDDTATADEYLKELNGAMNEGVEFALYVRRMHHANKIQSEEFKPYTEITREGERSMHAEEYESRCKRSNSAYRCTSDEFVLNLIGEVAVLKTSLGKMELPHKRYARFLELLIVSGSPVPISTIKSEVFDDCLTDGAVRTTINRLRSQVAVLFSVPMDQLIVNERKSSMRESTYQLCWNGTYYIYRRNF